MKFITTDNGIIRGYRTPAKEGDHAVASYDPATTLANCITVAINTDATRRPTRSAPADLVATVAGLGPSTGLARWGLHFVLDAAERHRTPEGDISNDLVPLAPDNLRGPGAVAEAESGANDAPQPTDATGYDSELATFVNMLSPQRYQMIGAVTGGAQDDAPPRRSWRRCTGWRCRSALP